MYEILIPTCLLDICKYPKLRSDVARPLNTKYKGSAEMLYIHVGKQYGSVLYSPCHLLISSEWQNVDRCLSRSILIAESSETAKLAG